MLLVLVVVVVVLLATDFPLSVSGQLRQCPPRAVNPFLPRFHIMGNLSQGPTQQPDMINDVSAVLLYRGVLHVFHQFAQTGWAHSVSFDGGAHWRNLPHAIVPDPSHTYDGRGSDDGSLTVRPDVNGGEPLILYDIAPAPTPSTASRVRDTDRPLLAVARAVDPTDPLLEVWAKDPRNPVAFSGPGACFPSTIWKNAQHWNFLSNGRRYFTDDPTFHTWQRSNITAEGFPAGGRGGQWFVRLPALSPASPTRGAAPQPAKLPTHVININHYTGDLGGGNKFELGVYHPGNESWTRLGESYSDYSPQFNWAALQYAGQRLVNVAWLTGIQGTRRNHHPYINRAPNSALSLLREVRYDPAVGELISQPLDEYKLLRNATLYQAAFLPLLPLHPHTPLSAGVNGTSTALPLTHGGDAIELRARFILPTERSDAMNVGVSVLAPQARVQQASLLNSTVVRVHVGAASATDGSRAGNLSVGIERRPGDPPLPETWQAWSAPFTVPANERDVDIVLFVDRSSAYLSPGPASQLQRTVMYTFQISAIVPHSYVLLMRV